MIQNFNIPRKSIAEQIITVIFSVLWMLYIIYVIHSLEMMYREQSLPIFNQHGITYEVYPRHDLYPQQQAPIIVTQPYFATVGEQANATHPTIHFNEKS